MKVIVWCLLIGLFAVSATRAALTANEKTSLQSILSTFPSLSKVPREYHYLGDSFVGGSWPTDGFDHVCEAPGEYFQINGVLCKNGHVVGLDLTRGWGHNVSATFDATGLNLQHLSHTNSISDESSICYMEAIFRDSRSLKSVKVTGWGYYFRMPPPSHPGTSGATIEKLEIDSFQRLTDLKHFTALKTVRLSAADPYSLDLDLSHLATRLESIEGGELGDLTNLSQFTALKRLDVTWWTWTQDQFLIIPNSLESLHIKGLYYGTLSVAVSSGVSSLKEAKFGMRHHAPLIFTSLPSSLRSLSFNHELFSLNASLELPPLAQLTLGRYGSRMTEGQWRAVSSSLQSLSLIRCARASLEPLKNLSSIRLPLKKLYLYPPPLPANMFSSWPYLEALYLSDNSLTGHIPTSNISTSLRVLDLSKNNLTSFSLTKSTKLPNLTHLLLSDNMLTTLPTNDVFDAMKKIEVFYVHNNPHLSMALPKFWSSSDTLKYFNATGCNFKGPIARLIDAPRLSDIKLSNNRLCGPLPDIYPLSSIGFIDLSYNSFSGTIPSSWTGAYIKSELNLRNNALSGTLPNPPGLPMPGIHVEYDFRYNNFTGGLFNFSTTLVDQLYFANTNINPCANDPSFQRQYVRIDLANGGAWCNCPTYYRNSRGVSNTTCPYGATYSDPVYIGVAPTYCDTYYDGPEPEPSTEEPPTPSSVSPADTTSSSCSLVPFVSLLLGWIFLHGILI